jgi:succinate dehydrogenase / fumarate reductase flavoprotein subunit
MRIYPAVHYTMGGLWVDYNLMSTIPGLFVLGEANFSDHGANRLGASALMQGLADGFFITPTTVANYLANENLEPATSTHDACREAQQKVIRKTESLLAVRGQKTADELHRELGKIMWERCGMARSEESLLRALQEIPKLREEFTHNLRVPGSSNSLNEELEKAQRVEDFINLGELMCRDALARRESCGGHFRTEHQTAEHEAQRDDENFCHVAVWKHEGDGKSPTRHSEALQFEYTKLATRSYK